jgi:hypothetical protein
MPNRYENIPLTRDTDQKNQMYQTNVYPDIPVTETDNYVITTLGDRLDLLALDFYSDTSYWWIIAAANDLPGDSLYPPVGMQLRIPDNPIPPNNLYKRENANR